MRPFIPFALPSIGEEEINEVVDTLRKGWLTTGEKTALFEQRFKEYIGAEAAIAVNSCTAALHLALVVANIQPGDEVITTPFTFAATGEVITYLGAKPIFVDIDQATYNIDPKKIEEKITTRTKAIIPVHFAGLPCEMDEIMAIAKKHNLIVIEDAAHAVGATYKGKKIGTIADMTAFSFYATKNLATGEGGMITTDNTKFDERLRILRLHGISKDAWKRYTQAGSWKYEILEQGYKYNLTDVASAIGIHQLAKLNEFNAIREKYAQIYTEAFRSIPEITLQEVTPYSKHAWHLFTICLDQSLDRDNVIEELKKRQIGASVHFIPLHLHPFYRKQHGYKKGDFPVAEKVSEGIISLPLYPAMSQEEITYVADAVKEIIETNRKKTKIVAIVTARMNSTRMYGKPMKLVQDKPIIEWCIERLQSCKKIDQVVIATSTKHENKVFISLANKLGIGYYAGDEEDVLDRFVQCAKKFGADHIVRATSENPLMYVEELDELLQSHLSTGADFTYTDKLPLGCFIEIISAKALQKSHEEGQKKHHSELVTLFINEHPEQFKINKHIAPKGLQRPDYRLTVDTEADVKLMQIIFDKLRNNRAWIPLQEVVDLLDKEQDLVKINSNIPVGESRIWTP